MGVIFTGTTIFIVGQTVLKFVIEPIISFKEAIGNISHIFLTNQGNIRGAQIDEKLAQKIRAASGMLLSKKQAVPLYKYTSCVFRLPSEEKVWKTCACLNVISHDAVGDKNTPTVRVTNQDEFKKCFEIEKLMHRIESKLNVTLFFGSIELEDLYE
jgi:hypothetical protein